MERLASSSFEMWAEKYRPKTLDNMVNQKKILNA